MIDIISTLKLSLANPLVTKIIALIIGVVIINVLFRLLSRSLPRYIQEADIRYHFRKLIIFLGYFCILVYATLVFSDRLGRLTVVFGVIGAGVAFALQEVIASVAGWIAISLGQFYKPGDRVLLGGIMGDVIDISILRTTVMECGNWVKADLYNGRIVRIANSFVFKAPVYNYSGDFPFVWDEITLPIKYGSDRPLAKAICQQVVYEVVGHYIPDAEAQWKKMVQKYLIEHQKIEPAVTIVANDNWIEFTIRYIVDYKQRRSTKDLLFTNLLDEIDKTNGQVAIASTTVHLVETPTVNVRLTNEKNYQ